MQTCFWDFSDTSLGYKVLSFILFHLLTDSMLHGSETWSVRKENEMALQKPEMRMVICSVKLKDRVSNNELRDRLGIVDIFSLLQQNRL